MLFEASALVTDTAAPLDPAEALAGTLALCDVREREPSLARAKGNIAAAAERKVALDGVFEPLSDLPSSALKSLLALAETIDPSDRGRVFDWLLTRRGRTGTPALDARLGLVLARLADAAERGLFDPACGEGVLLASGNLDAPRVGQEADVARWRVARQRMMLKGIDADVQTGNALDIDAFSDLRAETILTAPHGNEPNPLTAASLTAGRWNPALLRTKKAELVWLRYCLEHLSDKGRAYVLLSADSLSSRDAADVAIRTEMLANNEIEAIATLPATGDGRATPPTALWVLSPSDASATSDRVLLIDAASEFGFLARGEIKGPIFDDAIEDAAFPLTARLQTALDPWLAKNEVASIVREYAAAVPTLQLIRDGASLDPSRWVNQPANASELQRSLDDATEQFELGWKDLKKAVPQLVDTPNVMPTRWLPVRDLVAAGLAEVITGVRLPTDHSPGSDAEALPLVTSDGVRRFGPNAISRTVDVGLLRASPKLTEAGDVLVTVEDGLVRTTVTSESGAVLARPVQALRVVGDWLAPSLAAKFLEAQRNRRFLPRMGRSQLDIDDFELPVFADDSAAALAELITRLGATEAEADFLRDAAADTAAALIARAEADPS